jgi:Xaa-Pro aminopeptidase
MVFVAPSSVAASTTAKFSALRSLLEQQQLDGYLIPSADEHLNEYLPEVKQRRSWLSGFTGSAGDLLIGRDRAWLFVDSRYYEQAELEVGTGLMQICKLGLDGHKNLEDMLAELGREATKSDRKFHLGFDPFTLSVAQFRLFQKQLTSIGVKLVPLSENLVDRVRQQAPWDAEPLPDYATSPLFRLPEAETGETVAKKLGRVREGMQQANVQILPVTKLDQIAWLYNLRGWDVPYNPVFIAYALVTPTAAFLFTNLPRISAEIQQALQSDVTLLPYEQYGETLKSLAVSDRRVLVDPHHTTMGTRQLLAAERLRCEVVEMKTPIERLKVQKNPVEIAQMQQSNLKASRAKTRTLKWLADQQAAGVLPTEWDVAQTIERFYAEEAGFQGLSFNTIAATGTNSSIVHYGTPSPDQRLQPGAFLLLDSGAHFASGTTDDTRTVIIGNPTPNQIERYTEVLKAHINCAMQRFPKGATGAQLDGITRSTLWFAGLDYGHGTGHGVGAFLNVHEGPNGISRRVQEPLEPGMVTSVEPGYYEPNWGGIRIENLYVVRDLSPTESTADAAPKPLWYGLESLTYIPFDTKLIDATRLDSRQREWLDRYHQTVIAKLTPTLSPEEAEWLRSACRL